MLCIAEIACLVWGIIILINGRFKFASNKEVRGTPAYLVGALLLAVLPVAILIAMVVIVKEEMNGGNQKDGPLFDPKMILVDLAAFAICLIPALIISFASAKPIEKKRRRISRNDYDDYEAEEEVDHPRRRRRYEEESDDDEEDDDYSPRQRRRSARDDDDDDYDDDRPRRRRDDY